MDIRLALAVDSTGAIRSVKTFNDEVEKIPASAKKADGAVSGLKRQFDNFVSGISIGTGIAVANRAFDSMVAIIGNATSALLRYSDTMVTMNQRTALSLGSLQVFNVLAKTGGTTLETVAKAATLMEVAIGKGDTSFAKLGLSVSALKSMSPDAAFEKLATAIGGIKSPMEQAAAAVEIFGKKGAELLPLFTQKVSDARAQALEFGLVIGDKTLKAAEALGDAMDVARMSFDAFLMRLGGLIAENPAAIAGIEGVSRTFGLLSEAVEKNKGTVQEYVTSGIGFMVEGFKIGVQSVNLMIGVLESLVIIAKGAEIAFIAAGRAILELDRMRSYLVIGGSELRKNLDQQIAGADMLQKTLRAEQEELKKTREERNKFIATSLSKAFAVPPRPTSTGSGGAGGGGPNGFFDAGAGKVKEIKVDTLKIPSLPNLWMDLFHGQSQGKFGTLQGGSKTYDFWGDRSKFLPTEIEGGVHIDAKFKETKASISASQALQNLANIAQLSGSKLAKGLAGILGGGAGIAAGVSGLAGMKDLKGLTGLLGKAGAIGSIAASGISIVSGIFGLFKKKPKEPPPEPPKQATAEAWRSFTSDQLSKGATGILAGVSGIKVSTPEDMAAQASIASQVFWATFKEKGLVAAAEAFRPVRDKMLETFRAAGASDDTIGALLGPMSEQIDLAGNEAFAGAANGTKGFADALAAIANSQLPMTISQFQAFEQQAVAGYEQMKQAALDQGLTQQQAIEAAATASGVYLNTLKDAAAKYGFDLGGSQALFDEAAKAGVAFGGDSQERLILSIDRLTETLGGAPPKFEQAFRSAPAGSSAGGRAEDTQSTLSLDRASATLDRVAGVLAGIADRPIVVENHVTSTLNVNDDVLAVATADAIDRGGYGGQRMRDAIEGRG